MTREDIIRMAREAGWRESFTPPVAIYRFAALVEQHLIASGCRQCALRSPESSSNTKDES